MRIRFVRPLLAELRFGYCGFRPPFDRQRVQVEAGDEFEVGSVLYGETDRKTGLRHCRLDLGDGYSMVGVRNDFFEVIR